MCNAIDYFENFGMQPLLSVQGLRHLRCEEECIEGGKGFDLQTTEWSFEGKEIISTPSRLCT